VKIFLGILAASFAVWGVGDILRVRPDSIVATVGDQEISGGDLVRNFERQMRMMQARVGPRFTSQMAREQGLLGRALNDMVTRALFDQAAADLGLTVSEDRIAADIRNDPNFKDQLGGFDPERFRVVLSNNGYSEQGYLQIRRRDLIRDQIIDSVNGGIKAPKAMSNAFFRYQGQKRRFEVVTIPNASFPIVKAASNSDIKKYLDENKQRFTAPEYRALTYVTLRSEDIADRQVVEEADIKTRFEDRKAMLSRPEKRLVEQLLAGDKAKSDAAAKAIAGGEDFLKVAKRIAGLSASDVKLGELVKESLPSDVRDAVFALKKDEISKPVKGPFGWAIYRVRDIKPGSEADYAKLRDRMKRELQLKKAGAAIFAIANQFQDDLAGGARLEKIAHSLNLKVIKIKAVDAAGKSPNGKRLAKMPTVPEVISQAFRQDPNAEPELLENGSGDYYLVRVDDVTKPRLKNLAVVKGDIIQSIRRQRQHEAALAAAKKLAEQSRGVTKLSTMAQKAGYKSETLKLSTRLETVQRVVIASKLLEKAFNGARDELLSGGDRFGTSALVIRIVRIEEAQSSQSQELIGQLNQMLQSAIAGDVMEQFRGALQKQYGVEIDQRVVNALFADDEDS